MQTIADSGVVKCFIPLQTLPGTGYRLRMVSTDTAWTGSANMKDLTLKLCCKDPVDGGAISGDQYICHRMMPANLSSTIDASGGLGIVEYKWQVSTEASHADWADIPGTVQVSYQPPVFSLSTWYRRLARVDCKADWKGASSSNIVKMTVAPNTERYLEIESLVQPTCNPPEGCKLTVRGLPSANWTLEQTGPLNATLTGLDNPLLLENLPDRVYKLRVADANGCIESPPFGIIVQTW